jgi:hypothetical protein
LCLFFLKRFLRLWVAILCLFLFFPLGIIMLLYIGLHLADKSLSRLKSRNGVFRNNNGRILGDVTGSFLSPLLHDETPKTSEVYIFVTTEGILYGLHKSLYSFLYSYLLYSCVLRNLVYNICFSHFKKPLIINDLH